MHAHVYTGTRSEMEIANTFFIILKRHYWLSLIPYKKAFLNLFLYWLSFLPFLCLFKAIFRIVVTSEFRMFTGT